MGRCSSSEKISENQSGESIEIIEVVTPETPLRFPSSIDDVLFSPNESVFIVDYVDEPGEIRPVADPGAPTVQLPGQVDTVKFSSGGSLVALTYVDSQSELWDLSDPPRRLAILGAGLAQVVFDEASDRVVTRYRDGRSYLHDVSWLRASSKVPTLYPTTLIELACEGPLALDRFDVVKLKPFFPEGKPEACGDE